LKTKLVTVNGCFDVLHSGHLDLLEFAATQGDYLIVLLNSDESVKRFKGPNRPINSEKDRARMLLALKCVDEVVVFKEDTPTWWLELLQPAVHVKSKDAIPERVVFEKEIVEEFGGKIVVFQSENKLSTSKILEKLKS
jgi:rfaE bifunctional protein nucleotidyltransferase chain/domain